MYSNVIHTRKNMLEHCRIGGPLSVHILGSAANFVGKCL